MPSQADFVRDYAAKRASQMERARQLREMRAQAGGNAATERSAVTPTEVQPRARSPRMTPPSSTRNGARDFGNPQSPSSSTRSNPAVGYRQAAQPPPQTQAFEQPASYRQPVQQQQYEQAPPPVAVHPPQQQLRQPQQLSAGADDAVSISYADMVNAVHLGIITKIQCDQLWSVISQGAPAGAPPSLMSTAPPPVHPLHASGGGAPGVYNAGAYADDEMPAQPASRTRPVTKPAKSRKPEWNTEVGVSEDPEPEPVVEPPRRQVASANRTQKPQIRDWDTGDGDDADDGTFGAPPPVRGRVQKEKVRAPARREQMQHEHSMSHDGHPVVQAGRRAGHPAPTPVAAHQTTAVDDYDAELEEMELQKREAAERLEAELADADSTEPMMECPECGRSFRRTVCRRHMNTCGKTKKRRVFDMSKQRAEGVEGMQDVKRPGKREARTGRNKPAEQPIKAQAAMPKWKLQSEQLKAAMQASRAVKVAEELGLPPPPPVATRPELDDRVPCPHCSRKYAPDVAERHIPKCKNIVAKPGMRGGPRR